MRIRHFHIYEKMTENKCFLTAEGLRDRLFGKDETTSLTFLSIFEGHNEERKNGSPLTLPNLRQVDIILPVAAV